MSGGSAVRSLGFWLDRRASAEPDAPALTFGERCLSYAAFRDRLARMVSVLRTQGIASGDRVGLLAANHPDALVLLFAATSIGAVFVPLNIRLSAGELGYIASDSGLSLIVSDRANRKLIEPLRAELACKSWFAIDGGGEGWADLSAALENARPDFAIAEVDDDAVAAIVYTSGTTGRPKGAMLTHRNLWCNDLNWLFASDVSRHDTALIVAPLFHVGGLFVLTTTTLLTGGHIVLMPGFDAGTALAAIERHRVTTTFGVPAMMLFLSQHEGFDRADLSSLRLYVAGGAPVPEPLLRLYAARGIPVSQCYGLSEVVSATTFLETSRALEKLGSAGRAGMMSEVRLIDGAGAAIAAPGAKGEICVRGGNVSPGYWNNAEATARTIDAQGWLRTGDVGVFDAEGFLTMCDRVKDMIITGGENVYPAEVESHLFGHPAIADVAVIGRPDEKWGERVVAVAVLREAHELTLDQLQAFCDGRLARYKIPRELHLHEALPLNGSGKVIKAQLRATVGAE